MSLVGIESSNVGKTEKRFWAQGKVRRKWAVSVGYTNKHTTENVIADLYSYSSYSGIIEGE